MKTPREADRRRSTALVWLVVAGLWLGVPARPAWGWGRLGHRVAGRLAEDRLTPTARAAVRDLLEPGESLADASTWADEHRRDRPGSGAWHYVNVPITEPRYDPRFCPETGCVVSRIDDFRRILADETASRADRREALRFLVHLIEDLHMPLHVGDHGDKGGNAFQVQFFGHGSNLHRVWDSGLIERTGRDEAALVNDLESRTTEARAAAWATGSPVSWANESLAAARRAYQAPGSDTLLEPGARLGDAYQDACWPVARERLEQAAVRVAAVLNAIFP